MGSDQTKMSTKTLCRPNRCRPKLGCRPNWELRNYRDQMWINQIGFGQIVQHEGKTCFTWFTYQLFPYFHHDVFPHRNWLISTEFYSVTREKKGKTTRQQIEQKRSCSPLLLPFRKPPLYKPLMPWKKFLYEGIFLTNIVSNYIKWKCWLSLKGAKKLVCFWWIRQILFFHYQPKPNLL